jgi:hypothetical protein
MVLLALSSSSSLVGAETSLYVSSACDGNGFSGFLVDTTEGTKIHFSSCETLSGAESIITTGSLAPMTHLRYKGPYVDPEYDIGGLRYETPLTEADKEQMVAVYQLDESMLVPLLFDELVNAGYDPDSLPMRALAGNAISYEMAGIISPPCQDCDCLGCCGKGCAQCTGCYTSECLAHDACVRTYGGVSSSLAQCDELLFLAILSVMLYCLY